MNSEKFHAELDDGRDSESDYDLACHYFLHTAPVYFDDQQQEKRVNGKQLNIVSTGISYLLFNNMRVTLLKARWLSFTARSTAGLPSSTSSIMDFTIWLNSSVRGGRNDSKRLAVKSSMVKILRKWRQ
jgi:hypothetical protein